MGSSVAQDGHRVTGRPPSGRPSRAASSRRWPGGLLGREVSPYERSEVLALAPLDDAHLGNRLIELRVVANVFPEVLRGDPEGLRDRLEGQGGPAWCGVRPLLDHLDSRLDVTPQ